MAFRWKYSWQNMLVQMPVHVEATFLYRTTMGFETSRKTLCWPMMLYVLTERGDKTEKTSFLLLIFYILIMTD